MSICLINGFCIKFHKQKGIAHKDMHAPTHTHTPTKGTVRNLSPFLQCVVKISSSTNEENVQVKIQ